MTSLLDGRAHGAAVLVTGATGYVAGHLIDRLLEAGARVRATVRDPSDTDKIAHLLKMAERAPGSITFFRANLLEPGSHDEAMQGCAIVFHTASPFLDMAKVQDAQRDLVDPALKGTIDVLESVNRAASVKRVVLTSSAATMVGGTADLAKTNGVIGEESWNTQSSLEDGPYMYSKVLAEKAAWAMAQAQDRWQLVAINPGLVLGPGAAATQTSASFDRVRSLADGTFRDGLPPIRFGMVDVRDVAELHFRAAFDLQARGRYLAVENVYSLGDLADILKGRFGAGWEFPADTTVPPDPTGRRWDNSKAKQELGMAFRPIEPALLTMFEQAVAAQRK